jgi:histidinol-phosphate/aromatic aminotransferase/cobyric acid decarboxylase-like protein
MPFGATTIEAGQVMATNAAAAAVYAPASVTPENSVTAMGGVVTCYSVKARDFSTQPTFDLTVMEALVTPWTRMLLICNPHNPMGQAWSLSELHELNLPEACFVIWANVSSFLCPHVRNPPENTSSAEPLAIWRRSS